MINISKCTRSNTTSPLFSSIFHVRCSCLVVDKFYTESDTRFIKFLRLVLFYDNCINQLFYNYLLNQSILFQLQMFFFCNLPSFVFFFTSLINHLPGTIKQIVCCKAESSFKYFNTFTYCPSWISSISYLAISLLYGLKFYINFVLEMLFIYYNLFNEYKCKQQSTSRSG